MAEDTAAVLVERIALAMEHIAKLSMIARDSDIDTAVGHLLDGVDELKGDLDQLRKHRRRR